MKTNASKTPTTTIMRNVGLTIKPPTSIVSQEARRSSGYNNRVNITIRRFFPLILLLCLAPARAEVIRSFDTAIRLNRDTSLDVQETISYDFEGAQRHGIKRIIPIRYDRNGGTYTVYLDLQSVTDEKGIAQPYSTSKQGRDLNIKIGDADTLISGLHTYVLRYHLRRAVNFYEDAPEVYWNATGNEWPCPIQQASARFFPPPGVTAEQIRTKCFIGPPGSQAPGQVQVQADNVTFYTGSLPPGSGLTFVAGLPKNSVVPPSSLQNLVWILADWWPAFLIPLLALTSILAMWSATGRDVDGNQAVAVEWNPPKELSPAEVGTLVDERCDMADMVSTLIDLAARGYLVIEEMETEKFLFLSSRDYRFIKQPREYDPTGDGLAPHEREFMRGLFSGREQVTLSSLKNNFYTHLPGIQNAIYASLVAKRLFNQNPDSVRSSYVGIGFVLIVFGIIAGVIGANSGNLAWGIGLALSGLIVLLSARAMPAKTAKGSRLHRESLGFARFIKLAEKDRIRVLAQDDPTIFGRLLPYAMVLGVADDWADKFAGLLTEPPDWYSSRTPYSTFNPHFFVRDLGSGMNTMGNTFSSQPQSTGGSGGSGFSGGGGSGGGFGGGGGSSW